MVQRRDAIHQFTIISRFGFPDGVACWCGARLEFRPGDSNIQKKRKAFFDAHEECRPSTEKVGKSA